MNYVEDKWSKKETYTVSLNEALEVVNSFRTCSSPATEGVTYADFLNTENHLSLAKYFATSVCDMISHVSQSTTQQPSRTLASWVKHYNVPFSILVLSMKIYVKDFSLAGLDKHLELLFTIDRDSKSDLLRNKVFNLLLCRLSNSRFNDFDGNYERADPHHEHHDTFLAYGFQPFCVQKSETNGGDFSCFAKFVKDCDKHLKVAVKNQVVIPGWFAAGAIISLMPRFSWRNHILPLLLEFLLDCSPGMQAPMHFLELMSPPNVEALRVLDGSFLNFNIMTGVTDFRVLVQKAVDFQRPLGEVILEDLAGYLSVKKSMLTCDKSLRGKIAPVYIRKQEHVDACIKFIESSKNSAFRICRNDDNKALLVPNNEDFTDYEKRAKFSRSTGVLKPNTKVFNHVSSACLVVTTFFV